MKEISGYGYEWLTELFGGPLDGFRGTVMSINDEDPPEMWIEKVNSKKSNKNLGTRFLEQCTGHRPDDKVAVYKFSTDSLQKQICCYKYVETMTFKEYKNKYSKEQ